MFEPPAEDIVNLLPCAICSAPFDPATLPSHVYDPYQTFLLFTHNASICPSCFAEELAKRTRPDPDTFNQVTEWPITQQSLRAVLPGRSNSAATMMSHHREVHRKASSMASIPRNLSTLAENDFGFGHGQASSVNMFPDSGLRRETRSHDMLRDRNMVKERGSPHELYRHRPSTSIGHSSSSQRTSPDFAQQRDAYRHRPSVSIAEFSSTQRTSPESMQRSEKYGHRSLPSLGAPKTKQRISLDLAARRETNRHRPSTSLDHSLANRSQKASPDLPLRSQSLRKSPKIPQRVASRNHSRSQSLNQSLSLVQRTFTDFSSSGHGAAENASLSGNITQKNTDDVRRKVSFRQGAPIPQSFNPQSPPYHAVTPRVPSLPKQQVPEADHPQLVIPACKPVTLPDRLPSMLGIHHPHSVVQDMPPSNRISWSSWRIRRRQQRELREQKRQARKEQQRLRRLRDDKEKGIGVDLFCPVCKVVVKTTPKWRDGSCCVLSSTCFFLCTGPFCFCLLLPCAARQVLDVDGRCPQCTTTLSTWNRRKNQLTILTWAGARDSAVNERLPSLAPRPRTGHRLERQTSARMPPPAPTTPSVHYSRPRTATMASTFSRPRTVTVSSAAPTGISSMPTSRPRTMSSGLQTSTASTARSSGGSPPLTTRSSPSSRMAASATGTAFSNRTGSSSNPTGTVSQAGTIRTAGSGSTGTTLVNTGSAPQTVHAYQQHINDVPHVMATDFANFLDDTIRQEYVVGHHAITHTGIGGSAVPQQLLENIEMEEIGRALG